MVATYARNALGRGRLAVAVVLLWAHFAWAQTTSQPVERIRLDPADEQETSTGIVNTEQSGLSVQPGEAWKKPATVGGINGQLSTGIGYDANVFRTERDIRNDFFWSLQPAGYLNGFFGKHSYLLGYEGDYAKYFEFSTEDFYDHRVLGNTRLDLTRKIDLLFEAHYWWGHDPRGSPGNRVFVVGNLDRWQDYLAKTELVIGREISRAQIIPSLELSGRRYTNNDQSIRDFDTHAARVRGRWRFTSRLYGLVEGGFANIDHLDTRNTLDRTETEFLLGVGWQATAKTSGEALFGILYRNFKEPVQTTSENPTWNIRVHWEPETYSKLTAFTERASEENAGGTGNFLADTFGVGWRHAFSERLQLDTALDYTVAKFDTFREDKYLGFDLTLTYEVTRWLDLGGTYQYLNRRSNIADINYDDHMLLLELRIDFEHTLTP